MIDHEKAQSTIIDGTMIALHACVERCFCFLFIYPSLLHGLSTVHASPMHSRMTDFLALPSSIDMQRERMEVQSLKDINKCCKVLKFKYPHKTYAYASSRTKRHLKKRQKSTYRSRKCRSPLLCQIV